MISQPQHAWLFDVDGTLTHPEEKRITQHEILEEIIKRLERYEPVAFNTGRSLPWIIERIIEVLQQRMGDKSILSNFIAVAQKGGVWLTFSDDGQMQEFIDATISTLESLQQKVKKIVADKYPETMFYD